MDLESFLTTARWKLLEAISKKPSPPIQLANELKTSVAYVSQQLKLLETASLIKKDRTGTAEKGKPRVLFSISNDIVNLTILSSNFSAKKTIPLNDHNKTILKIWLIEDKTLSKALEKFFFLIENNLSEIYSIYLDSLSKRPRISIVIKSDRLKNKIQSTAREFQEYFDCLVISNSDKKASFENQYSIYESILNISEKMKGGMNKNAI